MNVGTRTDAAALAQSDVLLSKAQGDSRSGDEARSQKAGRDFESILLGSWLQGAQDSFAAAPGGPEEDEDGSREQFTGLGTQQLAASLVNAGGIGIARMIAAHLETPHNVFSPSKEAKETR